MLLLSSFFEVIKPFLDTSGKLYNICFKSEKFFNIQSKYCIVNWAL